MDKYISCEAAENAFLGRAEWWDWEAQAAIRAIPAADVVPVVRCGECKHWTENSVIPNIGTCVFTSIRHTAEFFCANGERKDGNKE